MNAEYFAVVDKRTGEIAEWTGAPFDGASLAEVRAEVASTYPVNGIDDVDSILSSLGVDVVPCSEEHMRAYRALEGK